MQKLFETNPRNHPLYRAQMSNNQQQQQQPSKNYQYAATTPSLSSLLNLAQIQDKKKPVAVGLAGGLASKPVKSTAAMGLASSIPLGTFKLKKPQEKPVLEKSQQVTETKELSEPGKIVTLATVVKPVKSETTAVNAKVEKLKTETHSKQNPKNQKNLQTAKQVQTSALPNDFFDPSHWRLFVGNLGPEVTDSLLLNTFKNAYPSTSKVLLVRDRKTQKSKGYSFVAFGDGKEFLKALKEMNGKWIGNRQCIIKKSDHHPKFHNLKG